MTRYTPLWLQAGSYAASVDRGLPGALWPAGGVAGCAVSPATAMTLNIAAGRVAVPSQNNTGSTLCSSDAVEQVTLATAPGSGTNRYDLVICQPRGADLDGGANNDWIFTTVTGTAATSPAVPAVPPGALALARVYVPGGSASVTAGNITDVRPPSLNAGRILAYKAISAPSYSMNSASMVLVDATNAVLNFVVPPSGLVLLTVGCAMNNGVAGVGANLRWSSAATANTNLITAGSATGHLDNIQNIYVEELSNVLTAGAAVSAYLQWSYAYAPGLVATDTAAPLVLKAIAL